MSVQCSECVLTCVVTPSAQHCHCPVFIMAGKSHETGSENLNNSSAESDIYDPELTIFLTTPICRAGLECLQKMTGNMFVNVKSI